MGPDYVFVTKRMLQGARPGPEFFRALALPDDGRKAYAGSVKAGKFNAVDLLNGTITVMEDPIGPTNVFSDGKVFGFFEWPDDTADDVHIYTREGVILQSVSIPGQLVQGFRQSAVSADTLRVIAPSYLAFERTLQIVDLP